jgi:YVTN family beta-propeller protein
MTYGNTAPDAPQQNPSQPQGSQIPSMPIQNLSPSQNPQPQIQGKPKQGNEKALLIGAIIVIILIAVEALYYAYSYLHQPSNTTILSSAVPKSTTSIPELVNTSIAMQCSVPSIQVGSSAVCRADVSGSSPTGTVAWSQSGTGSLSLSNLTCKLGSGECNIIVTGRVSSNVTLTATYNGDAGNAKSSSSTAFIVTPGVLSSLTVGGSPDYAIYDNGNKYVYILNGGPSYTSLGTVDVLSNTSVIKEISVGSDPVYGIYDDANGYLYILNYESDTVSVISNTSIIATIPVGSDPSSAVYDKCNGYIYVSAFNSGTVSIISGTSIIDTITLSKYGWLKYISYNPENGYVYVLNSLNNSVYVLSGTTLLKEIPTVTSPQYSIYNPKNGYTYILDDNKTIYAVNGTSIVSIIHLNTNPTYAFYNPQNGYIYVTNYQINKISIISRTFLISNITVSSNKSTGIVYLAYNPISKYLYERYENSVPVGDYAGKGFVSVVSGNSVIATMNVGIFPSYEVYDPSNNYIYIPSANDGIVTIIS